MSDERTVTRVAILAYPDSAATIVHGMYDLFSSVGREWELIVNGRPGPSLMEPLVVSSHRGTFATANGVPVTPHFSLGECPPVSVICIPEIAVPPGESLAGRFDEEVQWLRERHAQGTLLASACSGTMLLAQTGLLDGYEATTHWAYCDVLAKRHPKIRVHAQRVLVVSGEGDRLIMAGGGMFWLDLALYVIARTVGIDEAMQVARMNLIDWHAVGQQPFARLAKTRQVEDAAIGRAQAWIAEHYRDPAPVAAMGEASGLPERSFKRRFQNATGMSPLEYVHTLRLEEAKQLLEAGDAPVEEVALAVGYEDAGFFARLFKRRVALTPSHYRKRFGSMRRQLTR